MKKYVLKVLGQERVKSYYVEEIVRFYNICTKYVKKEDIEIIEETYNVEVY